MRKIILGSIILSAFHLSSLSSLAADDSNLIPNPGFEDSTTITYSFFVPGDSQDKNCRFAINTTTFHSGKQSALMQSDGFARFSLGPKVPYATVTGDRYRVGVWVKAGPDFQMEPGSPGLVMRLNLSLGYPPEPSSAGLTFIYPNNTVSQASSPPFSPLPTAAPSPTDWTHIEAVVEIPPGVDSVGPTLFFWKAKGSLYVDDFEFQKVDPKTPLTPMAGTTPPPASP
jgi:hypothetical protein